MLLLVDVGNTMIKWALVENVGAAIGQWLDSGAVAHKDADQLKPMLVQRPISRVLLSNVAGKAIRERLHDMMHTALSTDVVLEWFASADALAGIRNTYKKSGATRLRPVCGHDWRTHAFSRPGADCRLLRHGDHGGCGFRRRLVHWRHDFARPGSHGGVTSHAGPPICRRSPKTA